MNTNKNALVIGGTSGIGLAIALELANDCYGFGKIFITGRVKPSLNELPIEMRTQYCNKLQFINLLLPQKNYDSLGNLPFINTLIYSAGIGRIAKFEELSDAEIVRLIQVNELPAIQIIRKFYPRIISSIPFYCGIITSIAGLLSSPMFSVYGATKGALCRLVESLNAEIEACGFDNRILNIAPGHIDGTSFYGGVTELQKIKGLSQAIVEQLFSRETLYIPHYNDTYQTVLEQYRADSRAFGLNNYKYKNMQNRSAGRSIKIGYLSGTFDLFHIGHLNLIKRAKNLCDYLVVGVHPSGKRKGKETFIPFEERFEIVKNLSLVDEVIKAPEEDSDAYESIKYHYLFVGSDYKGTKRFERYEEMFADSDTKIIYFPYTSGTSSTQLRSKLNDHHSILSEI